jgi:hypothetical protein
MGKIGKTFALLLTLIIATSCLTILMVKPANAQTVPKPSVPEFTLKFINSSYSVVDPYTGISQQIDNSSIEVTIRNQQFAYTFNGSVYHLYYNIRTKPHFGGDWTERYPVIDRANSPYNTATKSFPASKYLNYESHPPLSSSSSDYTIVSFALNGENAYYPLTGLSSNAQIDFQVEAIVGHDSQAWYVQHPLYPEYGGFYESAIAYDTDSGWSSTKTIALSNGLVTSSTPNPATATPPSATPTTTPTSTSTAPDTNDNPANLITLPLEVFVIIVVVVVSLAVALSVLLYTRHRKISLPL